MHTISQTGPGLVFHTDHQNEDLALSPEGDHEYHAICIFLNIDLFLYIHYMSESRYSFLRRHLTRSEVMHQ